MKGFTYEKKDPMKSFTCVKKTMKGFTYEKKRSNERFYL